MIIKIQAVIRGKLMRNKLKAHPKYKNLFSDHTPLEKGLKTYFNEQVQQIKLRVGEFNYGERTDLDTRGLEIRSA